MFQDFGRAECGYLEMGLLQQGILAHINDFTHWFGPTGSGSIMHLNYASNF